MPVDLPIPFPFGGKDETVGHADQSPNTSPDMLNVRPFDAIEGRLRGGRRPGLSKWFGATIVGSTPIQELIKVVRPAETPAPQSQFALAGGEPTVGTNKFSVLIDAAGATINSFDTGAATQKVVTDSDGNLYIIGDRSSTWPGAGGVTRNVWKVSSSGTVLWTFDTGVNAASTNGRGGGIAHDPTNNRLLVAQAQSTTWLGNDGTNKNLWSLNADTGAVVWTQILRSVAFPVLLHAVEPMTDGNLVAVGSAGGGAGDTRSVWKVNGTTGAVIAEFKLGVTATDVTIDSANRVLIGSRNRTDGYAGATPGIEHNIWLLDSALALVSAFNQGSSASGSSGVGVQVDFTQDGDFVVASDRVSALTIRKFNASDVLVWSFDTGNHSPTTRTAVAVAANGDVAVCASQDNDWTGNDGSTRDFWLLNPTTGAVKAKFDLSFVDNHTNGGGCYAINVRGLSSGTTGVRTTSVVVVSNGKVRRVSSGSLLAPASGLGSVLSIQDFAVQGVGAFGNVYLIDGNVAKVWDLTANTVANWVAVSGTVPPKARLITLYRGRVVLAGFATDAHNWYMSRAGNPLDFNTAPAVSSALQAVAGNASEAGLVGDIVTALIPFSDDAMWIGGDGTIWQMSGDPAAGGSLDLVTAETGISFGRAWAKDPDGGVFFHGTDGIYRGFPGSKPENITRGRLDASFKGIDLTTHRVIMVWDFLRQGLVVAIVAAGSQAAEELFFYDKRTNGWFPEQYPGSFGPTSFLAADLDDPSDRAVLFGSRDGFIRQWDDVATNDDGQTIASRIRFAPLAIGGGLQEGMLLGTRIALAEGSGNLTLRAYAGQTAEQTRDLTTPRFTAPIKAGLNPLIQQRVRGNYVQLELNQAAASARWALETMFATVEGSGTAKRLRKS